VRRCRRTSDSPAVDARGEDGNARELVQGNGLAVMRQLGGGNGELATSGVKDVIEAAKNVCAEEVGTCHADEL